MMGHYRPYQRYRILFFPRKSLCSLTHSNLGTSVFFFPKRGKKNTVVFFFSQEKFTFHSLNFSGGAYIKNKEESYIFSEMQFVTSFYVVFFFPRSVFFSLYFFFSSWKSLRLTHSLISNVCIFLFPVSEKKKYCVFTHSLDLVKNITKINFSREIKKYGTFAAAQVLSL